MYFSMKRFRADSSYGFGVAAERLGFTAVWRKRKRCLSGSFASGKPHSDSIAVAVVGRQDAGRYLFCPRNF